MNTETNAEAGEGASAVRLRPLQVGAGLSVTLVALAVLGIFAFEDRGDSTGVSDARLVYCLDPAHEPAVANAAVDLGLASGVSGLDVIVTGHTLTLAQWRLNHQADFNRSCLAQSALAFPADGNGFGSTLIALSQVTLGAVLSFAVGGFATFRTRLSALAGELRAAWQAFAREVDEYAAAMPPGPKGKPPLGPLRERHADLRTVLGRVAVHRNGWEGVRTIRDEIDRELSPAVIAAGWPSDLPKAEIRRKAVSAELDKQATAIEKAAAAVERPLRRRGRP